MLRRYRALWPSEVGRVYRLLEMATEGCPGHGPVHLFVASACKIGFQWDPFRMGCLGVGCLCSVIWLVLFSIFKAAILDARLQLIFAVGSVFGVVHLVIFLVLCSCLILAHV